MVKAPRQTIFWFCLILALSISLAAIGLVILSYAPASDDPTGRMALRPGGGVVALALSIGFAAIILRQRYLAMTTAFIILLLAFLSEDFRIYSQLLEWGADPNLELQLTDDYPIPGDYSFATIISNGDSVMHLATVFPREPKWFSTTLSNRGDIHWVHPIERNNILQTYIARPTNLQPSTEKVQLLISLGSNLNQINSDGNTAALLATSSGNYEVAALLLKAGASADCYDLHDLQLIHHVAIDHRSRLELFENSAAARTNWDQSPLRPGWDELLQLLQERGYSLELAMQDLDRSDELVDGMPYLKWRKLQRAAQDSCKPTTAAAP